MAQALVETPSRGVRTENKNKEVASKITGDSLISFISGAQTNIGRGTFYNLKEEQRQVMLDQHLPLLEEARAFYALMVLPKGVNDVNKQLIAWNIINNTVREGNLKPHEHSPVTVWENELILQAFDNMQPNRVLDFTLMLQEKKVTKRRAMYLVHEWLGRNKGRWSLWAIKYRTPLKRLLRHFHTNKNSKLLQLWRYLKYDEHQNCEQIIQDYIAVQGGDKAKLAKLPSSVAEGFIKQFGITKEEFWELFTTKGGKFTAKEKRTKSESVRKAGASTKLDIEKLKLFDLLVHLNVLARLPKPKATIEALIKRKAKEIASKCSFSLDNVGIILDTSKSMYGTRDQANHPMLRGLAVSHVIKELSNGYKEYRTNGDTSLFPKLADQSNYADAVIKALKDGCETIILIGDGYENAPFEGALHQLLYTYKKKIDKKNKLMVLHFNPVFAAEAGDVRSITDLAPQIGIREIEGMNEAMFLAIAKNRPQLAIKKYLGYLASLQSEKVKALMPTSVKKLLTTKKLLGE